MQYNPKDIASALKKNGGFVPGVRPGIQTEEFIQKLLNRITLSGAIFLAFIAITPDIIIKIWDLQKYQSLASLFGGYFSIDYCWRYPRHFKTNRIANHYAPI